MGMGTRKCVPFPYITNLITKKYKIMNWITVSADVDLDDVLSGMSSRELQDLVDELYEDGYVPKKLEKQEEKRQPSLVESFLQEALEKISNNYHGLTSEEEEQILKIAKRF